MQTDSSHISTDLDNILDTTLDEQFTSGSDSNQDSDPIEVDPVEEVHTSSNCIPDIPMEFAGLMTDFINDITITFPEYKPIISKWWGFDSYTGSQLMSLFVHCLTIYPARFADIIYKSDTIFNDASTINTDFLPGISFKYLMMCDNVSEKTRVTVWKYLQTIVLCVVGSIDTKDMTKEMKTIFDSIDEDTFREKLCDTVADIQNMFEAGTTASTNSEGASSEGASSEGATDFSKSMDELVGGKLGALAKDLLGDTMGNISDSDFSDTDNPADIIKKLCEKDGGLMNMANSVTQKLHSKIESGEYNHAELLQEATGVLQNMKDMPGMEMIKNLMSGGAGGAGGAGGGGGGGGVPDVNGLADILSNMTGGAGGAGGAPDVNGLAGILSNMMGSGGTGTGTKSEHTPKKPNHVTQMKQRIEKRRLQEVIATQQMQNASKQNATQPMSDEELISMMESNESNESNSNVNYKTVSIDKGALKKKKSKNKK